MMGNPLRLKVVQNLTRWGTRQIDSLKQLFTKIKTASINSTFLSSRTHCRFIFCGRGKSLEDPKLGYGPVQLCSIIRDAMLSHYELYKIARIFHSGTLPSCL